MAKRGYRMATKLIQLASSKVKGCNLSKSVISSGELMGSSDTFFSAAF
jgi:hypothetical protein